MRFGGEALDSLWFRGSFNDGRFGRVAAHDQAGCGQPADDPREPARGGWTAGGRDESAPGEDGNAHGCGSRFQIVLFPDRGLRTEDPGRMIPSRRVPRPFGAEHGHSDIDLLVITK